MLFSTDSAFEKALDDAMVAVFPATAANTDPSSAAAKNLEALKADLKPCALFAHRECDEKNVPFKENMELFPHFLLFAALNHKHPQLYEKFLGSLKEYQPPASSSLMALRDQTNADGSSQKPAKVVDIKVALSHQAKKNKIENFVARLRNMKLFDSYGKGLDAFKPLPSRVGAGSAGSPGFGRGALAAEKEEELEPEVQQYFSMTQQQQQQQKQLGDEHDSANSINNDLPVAANVEGAQSQDGNQTRRPLASSAGNSPIDPLPPSAAAHHHHQHQHQQHYQQFRPPSPTDSIQRNRASLTSSPLLQDQHYPNPSALSGLYVELPHKHQQQMSAGGLPPSPGAGPQRLIVTPSSRPGAPLATGGAAPRLASNGNSPQDPPLQLQPSSGGTSPYGFGLNTLTDALAQAHASATGGASQSGSQSPLQNSFYNRSPAGTPIGHSVPPPLGGGNQLSFGGESTPNLAAREQEKYRVVLQKEINGKESLPSFLKMSQAEKSSCRNIAELKQKVLDLARINDPDLYKGISLLSHDILVVEVADDGTERKALFRNGNQLQMKTKIHVIPKFRESEPEPPHGTSAASAVRQSRSDNYNAELGESLDTFHRPSNSQQQPHLPTGGFKLPSLGAPSPVQTRAALANSGGAEGPKMNSSGLPADLWSSADDAFSPQARRETIPRSATKQQQSQTEAHQSKTAAPAPAAPSASIQRPIPTGESLDLTTPADVKRFASKQQQQQQAGAPSKTPSAPTPLLGKKIASVVVKNPGLPSTSIPKPSGSSSASRSKSKDAGSGETGIQNGNKKSTSLERQQEVQKNSDGTTTGFDLDALVANSAHLLRASGTTGGSLVLPGSDGEDEEDNLPLSTVLKAKYKHQAEVVQAIEHYDDRKKAATAAAAADRKAHSSRYAEKLGPSSHGGFGADTTNTAVPAQKKPRKTREAKLKQALEQAGVAANADLGFGGGVEEDPNGEEPEEQQQAAAKQRRRARHNQAQQHKHLAFHPQDYDTLLELCHPEIKQQQEQAARREREKEEKKAAKEREGGGRRRKGLGGAAAVVEEEELDAEGGNTNMGGGFFFSGTTAGTASGFAAPQWSVATSLMKLRGILNPAEENMFFAAAATVEEINNKKRHREEGEADDGGDNDDAKKDVYDASHPLLNMYRLQHLRCERPPLEEQEPSATANSPKQEETATSSVCIPGALEAPVVSCPSTETPAGAKRKRDDGVGGEAGEVQQHINARAFLSGSATSVSLKVFEDPVCVYCQKLDRNPTGASNVAFLALKNQQRSISAAAKKQQHKEQQQQQVEEEDANEESGEIAVAQGFAENIMNPPQEGTHKQQSDALPAEASGSSSSSYTLPTIMGCFELYQCSCCLLLMHPATCMPMPIRDPPQGPFVCSVCSLKTLAERQLANENLAAWEQSSYQTSSKATIIRRNGAEKEDRGSLRSNNGRRQASPSIAAAHNSASPSKQHESSGVATTATATSSSPNARRAGSGSSSNALFSSPPANGASSDGSLKRQEDYVSRVCDQMRDHLQDYARAEEACVGHVFASSSSTTGGAPPSSASQHQACARPIARWDPSFGEVRQATVVSSGLGTQHSSGDAEGEDGTAASLSKKRKRKERLVSFRNVLMEIDRLQASEAEGRHTPEGSSSADDLRRLRRSVLQEAKGLHWTSMLSELHPISLCSGDELAQLFACNSGSNSGQNQ